MAINVLLTFEDIKPADLAAMSPEDRDHLPYGVIGLDRDGVAVVYNATEERLAGLRAENVIGAPFFDTIAQCMNNFLVAQRFIDEVELDAIIPFVLTLRMRPTPVRLRLLATSNEPLHYILIER